MKDSHKFWDTSWIVSVSSIKIPKELRLECLNSGLESRNKRVRRDIARKPYRVERGVLFSESTHERSGNHNHVHCSILILYHNGIL